MWDGWSRGGSSCSLGFAFELLASVDVLVVRSGVASVRPFAERPRASSSRSHRASIGESSASSRSSPIPSAPDRPAARAASPATARPTDSPPGRPAASASRPPSPPENRTFPGKLRGSGRTAPGRGAATVSPRKQQAQPQNGATSPKQRLRAADHVYPGEVASSALLVLRKGPRPSRRTVSVSAVIVEGGFDGSGACFGDACGRDA